MMPFCQSHKVRVSAMLDTSGLSVANFNAAEQATSLDRPHR